MESVELRNRSSRIRSVILLVGVSLWILLPLAMVAAITFQVRISNFTSPTVVRLHPERNTEDFSRTVFLGLQWSDPGTLRAPAWTGTVQEVLISAGQQITNGTPLLRIDGVQRVAASTEWPFSRPLTIGDQGTDVLHLTAWLQTQGIGVDSSDSFSYDTLSGVRELATRLDVPAADDISFFDPSWLIFINGDATVQEVAVGVGAPAPVTGEEFITLQPTLSRAVLQGDDKGQRTNQRSNNEETISEDSNEDELVPSETAGSLEKLFIQDIEIPLDDSRQGLSEEGLSLLSDVVEGTPESIQASLRQENVPNSWVVPATAVVSGESGQTCIFLQNGSTETETQANVIHSVGGKVIVSAKLQEDDLVILFPISQKRVCQS